jgi:hypothetical protein
MIGIRCYCCSGCSLNIFNQMTTIEQLIVVLYFNTLFDLVLTTVKLNSLSFDR